jgi:hypothetical protein
MGHHFDGDTFDNGKHAHACLALPMKTPLAHTNTVLVLAFYAPVEK